MAGNILNARRGKYRILDQVGRGGYGTVHKGRDLKNGRTVAVKVRREREITLIEVLALR